MLPPGASLAAQSTMLRAPSTAASAPLSDVVAIDAGGPATGSFAADEDVVGGQTSAVTAAINVGATNAAPQAVYQTQRYGPATYTIPKLMPGVVYTVRLHFAETYFGVAGRAGTGQRMFNVAINGVSTLSNFDIFAAAGGANIAVVRDFSAVATASGTIVIAFTNGSANNAAINGIEILLQAAAQQIDIGGNGTTVSAINVGGPSVGTFVADMDGTGGTITLTSHAIDVSAPNAAPEAVYQSQRFGPMTYTLPGFTPGASYIVRLHFAELYWGVNGHPGGAGSRQFNVAIDGTRVLTNLDVSAKAGGYKALVIDEPVTAPANGTFTIALTNGAADNAMINAIQVLPAQADDVQAVAIGSTSAVGTFAADTLPNGGTNGTISTTTATINVTAANAAPMDVYQAQRFGAITRVFSGLTPGVAYTLRLHFAEIYWGLGGRKGAGAREFNVAINGVPELTNFDVYATAGGANVALVRDFAAYADTNGDITLALEPGAADNPMVSGAEIIAGWAADAEPIAIGSETPHASDAFVDSIGINTHFSDFQTLYGNFNLTASLLHNAGIRHIRDGTPAGNASLCAQEATLASMGVHMNVLTDGKNTDLATGLQCLGATAETIEAPNEADLNGGPNWVSWLTANTEAMATTFPTYPLIAPSVTTIAAEQSLGSLASTISDGNAHAYFAGRNPGTPGWGGGTQWGTYGSLAYNLGLVGIVSGTKPVFITETGYSDAVDQYALPAVTKARYLLRTSLEAWNHGVPRTFYYELADEGSPQFSHYGIVDASGNPKPAYVALSGFIAHLSDPGGSFALTPLAYDMSAPSTVHHTLLQKRNGHYELVVWNEVPEWDPNANATIATTPQPVEITFGKPPSALDETTFADSGAISTTSIAPGGSFSLSVSTWPTIVDITP